MCGLFSGLKSDKIFALMQMGIKAQGEDLVKKIKAVFRFDITKKGKTVKYWLVDLKNGSGKIEEAKKTTKAQCTIKISDRNFAKLMKGTLNPMTAFTTGAVKVTGNVMLAMKLQKLTKLVKQAAPMHVPTKRQHTATARPMASLISSAEKTLINEALSKFQRPPLRMTVARLYVSNGEFGGTWHDTGAWGGILLFIDREFEKLPNILRLIDLGAPKKTLFQQELYLTMVYSTPQPDFHTFEIPNGKIVGLRFCDVNEAKGFGSMVQGRLSKMMRDQQLSSPSHVNAERARKRSLWGGFKRGVGKFFGIKKQEKKIHSVGRPTGFKHVSHIGYDPDKGFDIGSIPESWRRIFKEAGISKKVLKNKQAAQLIFQTIQQSMMAPPPAIQAPAPASKTASYTPSGFHDAPPPLPRESNRDQPTDEKAPPRPPGAFSSVPAPPASMNKPPPGPSIPPPPQLDLPSFDPPPPGLPPPPELDGGMLPAPGGGGPPPPPRKKSSVGGGPPPFAKKKSPPPRKPQLNMFDEMKQKKLRKTEAKSPNQKDLPPLNASQEEQMVNKLRQQLAAMRENLIEDDDDDEEWSD
ncbi:hypothetical protein AAMO2058_001678500 [Amorphochlora amoebiformis]